MTNIQLSNQTIANIIEHGSDEHKRKLLKTRTSELTPRHLFNMLYYSSDPEIHEEVFKHPKIDSNFLHQTARFFKDHSIHEQIIQHPKVSSDTLSNIHNFGDDEMRSLVEKHPKWKNK